MDKIMIVVPNTFLMKLGVYIYVFIVGNTNIVEIVLKIILYGNWVMVRYLLLMTTDFGKMDMVISIINRKVIGKKTRKIPSNFALKTHDHVAAVFH